MNIFNIILTLLLLSMITASCGNNEEVALKTDERPPIIENNIAKHLQIRSVEAAVQITNNLLASGSNSLHRGLTVSVDDVNVISSPNGDGADVDTLMYAVNIGKNQGFTLISAQASVPAILAYTDKGEYGSEATNSNEQIQFALDLARNYVAMSAVIIDTSRPIAIGTDLIPIYYHDTIDIHYNTGTRIKVKWGTAWPENMYAPNKDAGYTPVAIAQIASYFEYPTKLHLTYPDPDRDINTIDLSWGSINAHTLSDTICNPSDSYIREHCTKCGGIEQHQSMAYLIREIGHRCDASYGSNRTIVDIHSMLINLPQIIPDKSYSSGYHLSGLIKSLKSSGVAICMYSTTTTRSWVIDGYMKLRYDVQYLGSSTATNYAVVDTDLIEEDYFHINWCCGGDSNGFFLGKIFNVSQGNFYKGQQRNDKPRLDYMYVQ